MCPVEYNRVVLCIIKLTLQRPPLEKNDCLTFPRVRTITVETSVFRRNDQEY